MFPEDYNRYSPPPPAPYQPQPTGPALSFRYGAIYPFQCLSDGWQLLKDQYLLYAAMFLLIILLTTCIGITGLFWGAWTVGIYSAFWGACAASRLRSALWAKAFNSSAPGCSLPF